MMRGCNRNAHSTFHENVALLTVTRNKMHLAGTTYSDHLEHSLVVTNVCFPFGYLPTDLINKIK